ncbi:MAG: Unknown protein [uncultured Sulfurovum sp.]|uniref:Periplasmic protein n=1 Tax=uncultured Sulfurovum sp. TaxID=269237 RepID=A0A6S6TSE6_9BACT|nr:MAG: Unknown protein [uncultured Sulfurovum sp.]
MTPKKPKIFIGLTALVTITVSLLANNPNNEIPLKDLRTICCMKMSTAELQEEVEKLSQIGKLPFEMGIELIKRWQEEDKKQI